jgi:hypothetical protein
MSKILILEVTVPTNINSVIATSAIINLPIVEDARIIRVIKEDSQDEA